MPPSESPRQAAFPIPNPANNLPDSPRQTLAHSPYPSTRDNSKTIRIGLTSAGLCIIAGSLLLVFVYLVGQGFLPAGGTPTTSNTHTTLTTDQTATAIHPSTPTPLPITPTPTLPSQGLLDTAMLSNDFNSIQPLTDFKVNQKIYLVFTPHAGGNSHTACVNWYLNDQLVNTYSQSIVSMPNVKYYFYVSMSNTGNGRADISLSSTTACTDSIMAKTLNFTVAG